MLNSLARVLHLDSVETAHLHNLAHCPGLSSLSQPEPEFLAPRVSALLASLGESVPAIMLGRRGDVLAWNRTGHALIAEHLDYEAPYVTATRPLIPRMFFLDLLHRDLYRNWEELARIHVGYLRLTSGRYPDDQKLAELIGELSLCTVPSSPIPGPPATSQTAPAAP